MIVVGIAGVVAVLVAMLAMGNGFQAQLNGTGDETSAIVLRGGSQAEANSVITRDQLPLIGRLPGIARDANGRPLVSAELSQVVALPSKSDGSDTNVQVRGVGEEAWAVHERMRIIQGRRFKPGMRELVVGQGALHQFGGLSVGQPLKLGNQQWQVVGVFASGDAHDSELWADAETLASAYNRRAYQSVTVRTEGKAGFEQFRAAMAGDPRLKLDVETTRAYYAKQGGGLDKLLTIGHGDRRDHGGGRGVRRAQYDVCGGGRPRPRDRHHARDRVPWPAGGDSGDAGNHAAGAAGRVAGRRAGVAAVQQLQRVHAGQNFSQVVFQFKVSAPLLWSGLKWALAIGLVGGLFPALRAARLPITQALREV